LRHGFSTFTSTSAGPLGSALFNVSDALSRRTGLPVSGTVALGAFDWPREPLLS
jgi:hypothetical protein